MQLILEPLQFVPELKDRIWGAPCRPDFLPQEQIIKGKQQEKIGEYWYIYDQPGNSSLIRSGTYHGKTLHDLLEEYGSEAIVGKGIKTGSFPIMIKILIAKENLSIQVHPTPDNPFGDESKDEIWYPLEFTKDHKFIIGTQKNVIPEEFWNSVYDLERLLPMLQSYTVSGEEAYLIPAGCIHSLSKNSTVLEIQDNSDTTYRISDWGRTTADGKHRELHLEKAKRTVNFNSAAELAFGNSGSVFEKENISFTVHKLQLKHQEVASYSTEQKSFHILSAVSGDFCLRYDGKDFMVKYGDSILVPACCGTYQCTAVGKTSHLLQTQLHNSYCSKKTDLKY